MRLPTRLFWRSLGPIRGGLIVLGGAVLLVTAAQGIGSCSCGRAEPDPSLTVFHPHQFLTGSGTLGLGQSCASGGQSDCAPPGICLRYSAWALDRLVCSKTCQTDMDCPGASGSTGPWACAAPLPGAQRLCFAPKDFVPALLAVRQPVAPGTRPAGSANPTPISGGGADGGMDGGAR